MVGFLYQRHLISDTETDRPNQEKNKLIKKIAQKNGKDKQCLLTARSLTAPKV